MCDAAESAIQSMASGGSGVAALLCVRCVHQRWRLRRSECLGDRVGDASMGTRTQAAFAVPLLMIRMSTVATPLHTGRLGGAAPSTGFAATRQRSGHMHV
jgi:hypothetical protein